MSRTAIERFWDEARSANPALPATGYKIRTFGRDAAMSDILIELIASGQKTGTFGLEEEYRRHPALRPEAGDHFVVTRFDGTPAFIYRIIELETVPFRDIGARHVAVEGPNARNVDVWRQIHWPYWGGMLREWGLEPREDMPVVFQRFVLAYPQVPSPSARQ